MTDPLDAATRAMAELDQQMAACRDANGRLTAETVRLEIELRASRTALQNSERLVDIQKDAILDLKADVADLTAQLIAQNVYIDELEHKLDRQGGHNGY